MRGIFRSSTAAVAAFAAMMAAASADAQTKTRALRNAERLIVEKSIKEMLVDPDSAKFEIKPFVVGSKLACGRFNSKNRMGGYTGYKAFEVAIVTNGAGVITSGSLPEHYDWGDELSSAIMASAHCNKVGYDIPDPRPEFNR